MVLAAGWGWFAGNFTPAGSDWWNYLIHAIPFLILLALGLRFLYVSDAHQYGRTSAGRAKIGLSIFAVCSFALFAVGIISGVVNPTPDAYAIVTAADWFPAIAVILGALMWLTTLIPAGQGHSEAKTVSSK